MVCRLGDGVKGGVRESREGKGGEGGRGGGGGGEKERMSMRNVAPYVLLGCLGPW